MTFRFLFALLVLVIPLLGGCGPRPVVGGTSGVLLAGGEPVADLQLTVYQQLDGAWQPIGFADTASDGTFRLLVNEARGPLELSPGEYRFTLQSVGAPLLIPQQLAEVDATSLRVHWTGTEPQLALSLPAKLAARR